MMSLFAIDDTLFIDAGLRHAMASPPSPYFDAAACHCYMMSRRRFATLFTHGRANAAFAIRRCFIKPRCFITTPLRC